MAGKKDSAASREKKHAATVKKLEAAVEQANAKAARWKKQAKQDRSAAAAARADVARLEKKLAKSRRKARPSSGDRVEATAALAPVEETSPASPTPPQAAPAAAPAAGPDDTWTVVALRAEARERGLTGFSNKSKAELLAALT